MSVFKEDRGLSKNAVSVEGAAVCDKMLPVSSVKILPQLIREGAQSLLTMLTQGPKFGKT